MVMGLPITITIVTHHSQRVGKPKLSLDAMGMGAILVMSGALTNTLSTTLKPGREVQLIVGEITLSPFVIHMVT